MPEGHTVTKCFVRKCIFQCSEIKSESGGISHIKEPPQNIKRYLAAAPPLFSYRPPFCGSCPVSHFQKNTINPTSSPSPARYTRPISRDAFSAPSVYIHRSFLVNGAFSQGRSSVRGLCISHRDCCPPKPSPGPDCCPPKPPPDPNCDPPKPPDPECISREYL